MMHIHHVEDETKREEKNDDAYKLTPNAIHMLWTGHLRKP